MRYLVIARHGETEKSQISLTPEGIAGIESLAKSIPLNFEEVSARIMSSTALRALKTAAILSNELGVFDISEEHYLWSGPDNPQEHRGAYDEGIPSAKKALLGLVERRGEGIEALIIVSHLEVCRDLPELIAEKHGIGYNPKRIEKGRGVFFDLEQKSYRFVP